ncbi:class I adenylate-forming enzyme family protein [Massilia cavernae]|uniref:Long-chain fatty acid--CoA ligase n=1 Tax=Massilia cavernae TaxID=2320864 RepID=A0A418XVC3_9BURK|nr:AMP-binding protein [Massilia cavernae]RJG16680.1 long-chain fatty acid--CoA ligase [Massilia cavernae]
MSQTISSALTWWARITPETVAIDIDGDKLRYRDYHDWADRVAVRLIALGLKPGERVGISASNCVEYCALFMGVIRAAGIVLPINPRLTDHEIGEILEDTTPALVFADTERQARMAGIGIPVFNIEDVAALRAGPRQAPGLDLDPDAAVAIITTSGSTARPKGVVYSHRSMTSCSNEFALQFPDCVQGARMLLIPPFSTSGGSVLLVTHTVLGNTLYVEPSFDPERAIDLIAGEGITVFSAVPIFLERIAASPRFAQADLSSLRLVTVGGAPVSRAVLDTWIGKGVVIRQLYGQTEVGGFATIMPAAAARDQPEKCGRGGVYTDIRVVGDDGQSCPPGQPGEILLRGPGMMLGYWNNPEATADVLRAGWLHTGDIGVLDEDGLLTFVDRKKDIIISGGLNISAAEVERAVGAYAGIREVAVIAAADEKFGETPMAVVYADVPVAVELLVAHCCARLADYKVPRYVVVLDQPLPRLATGKLSKVALRKQYKDAAATLPRVR